MTTKTNEKYRIREICGDWALDIPFPGSVVTIFFNSRANAELVKKILIHEDAHPGEAVPFEQDYFSDTTKMVPLTLDQLREMYEQPVFIDDKKEPENTGWVIWSDSFNRNWTEGKDGKEYGKTWFAYACPTVHIDREAWTAEWTVDEFGHKCSKCGEYLPDEEDVKKPQFCPECGRATTPEAWAMLEKRLRR